MVKLELQRFFTHCFSDIPNGILEDFESPISFYLSHPLDPSRSLIDACVLFPSERRIEHSNLMTNRNLKTMESENAWGRYNSTAFFHPHCTIFEPSRDRYVIFSELSEFFYRMDLRSLECQLLRWLDVFPEWAAEKTLFGATFAWDEAGSGKFYMTASKGGKDGFEIGLFHTDTDFSNGRPVGTFPSWTNFCPHMTRKSGRELLNSNFYNVEYSLFGGERKMFRPELYETVFKKLHEDFVNERPEAREEGGFYNHFEQKIPFPKLSKAFEEYYLSVLEKEGCPDFLRLCWKKYAMEVVPWSFFTYDLDGNALKEYPTTLPTPAHFELSKRGDVFVSCHNFLTFEKVFLLWPAAIDRFEKTPDGYRFAGSLSHPTGYRFTSHKVFELQGKTKVCAIWQTERLFVFDVETMSLEYYLDLEKEYAEASDESRFWNPPIVATGVIGAFEISASGRYAFVFSQRWLGIVDLVKRKLVGDYEKLSGKTPDGYEMGGFVKKCAHCQYLDSDYVI